MTIEPVPGTWVQRTSAKGVIGRVLTYQNGNGSEAKGFVEVDWIAPGTQPSRHAPSELESGLKPGFIVQNAPLNPAHKTLGPAQVLAVRRLAEVDMALVQLQSDGRSLWLPALSLVRIMNPELRFLRAEPGHADAAERWAVGLMAHALRSWNDVTGALDRLDIDALPHQIQLVHHIIASGHLNWVIADDVGLGKTIEVGLLLASLERRRLARRVLILCPASLTRQWQDEMRVKFDREFDIYHADFEVAEAHRWRLHDTVIASLDLMKPKGSEDHGSDFASHFAKLLAAPAWDLVIFDEAHRLSKADDGGQTLRYRLARDLREKAGGFLLLTGTPHQGDTGKFRNLLMLARPDLAEPLRQLEFKPAIIREIVLRNRKIDVTDAEGNFVFRGHTVKRIEIAAIPETMRLEEDLAAYLRRGYRASELRGGRDGRAIGFVMTIYRKLASSSVAALQTALRRRLDRLRGQDFDYEATVAEIARETGDGAEIAEAPLKEAFFENEEAMLESLIRRCASAMASDVKLRQLRAIVKEVVETRGEKLLIFTEFRATQDYLARKLSALLDRPVALIHGSQKLDEKLASIEAFAADTPLLISTEAGGEGLNLHRGCHTLLNYDLPWNPARLVQRIGRLYRYGQTKHVVIFNLHARDTIDNEVLDIALSRVAAVAREMAPVGGEFGEGYAAEILGELLDQLDLSEVLSNAQNLDVERARERIEDAVERARRARGLQAEMLAHVVKFDPEAVQRLGGFTTEHLARFIRRAAPLLGFEAHERGKDAQSLTLRLPKELIGQFAECGQRSVIEATTDRRKWSREGHALLLDFGSSFVRHIIDQAMRPEFGGLYASSPLLPGDTACLAAFRARWQTDQGEPSGQELMIAAKSGDGNISLDNRLLHPLFDAPIPTATPPLRAGAERQEILSSLRDRVEVAMAQKANPFRLPCDLSLLAIGEASEAGFEDLTQRREQSH